MSLLKKIFGRDERKSVDDISPVQVVIPEIITSVPHDSVPEPYDGGTQMVRPATNAVTIRRNGTPPPTQYMGIVSIGMTSKDIDTIIIRYPKPHMIGNIRLLVQSYAQKNATSYINQFIEVDIFINLSLSPHFVDKHKLRGAKWLRVAYELTENNKTLSAVTRFPQSLVVEVNQMIDKPDMTLDMLIGGMK